MSQLQRTLYGETRDELTEPELRVLEAGGFDLDPRKQEGADPLAQAAAEYAALLKTSFTTATQRAVFFSSGSRSLPLDRGVWENIAQLLDRPL